MASWAKPGVKCICIDADPIQGTAWNHGDEVIEGAAYTIRKVWVDVKGALVMDFVEKVRSPLPFGASAPSSPKPKTKT